MNTKESFSWYVEFTRTPNGIYNRIFRRVNGNLVYEMDLYTTEPVNVQNDELSYNTIKE